MSARKVIAAALLAGLALAGPADAAAYYEGKSITLLVGNAAGGGYDAYARLLARHMGNHIPGQPSFVVKNMPEGGGLAMANNLAAIAQRDGFTIGLGSKQIPFEPLFQNPAAKYKLTDLTWIGTPSSYGNDAYLLFVRSDTPYMTLADLQKPGQAAFFGASIAGQLDIDVLLISKAVFKLNIDLIRGYPGSTQMALAMERKEVEGLATGMSALQHGYADWMKDNRIRFLMLYGKDKRWARLPEVPTALEMVKSEEDRELVELIEFPLRIARPVMAPPKLPAEVTSTLRRAFMETNRDPAYLAEAERLKLDISPLGGAEMEAVLMEAAKIPPQIVARYKQITEGK